MQLSICSQYVAEVSDVFVIRIRAFEAKSDMLLSIDEAGVEWFIQAFAKKVKLDHLLDPVKAYLVDAHAEVMLSVEADMHTA